MKIRFVSIVIALICALSAQSACAQEYNEEKTRKWAIGAQYGVAMAFGDDSYNVFGDFSNAAGQAISLSFGRQITPLWGARIKGRYLKLYSRCNLEFLEFHREDHPELLPRDGFYGYNCYAAQVEGTLNLVNLLMPNRWEENFNIYLIAGVGANLATNYDKHVYDWSTDAGILNPVCYNVETGNHFMPTGVIGGSIDIKIVDNVSFNIEALCTFTGDKLEGVKYEEGYDAYVTASAGITVHF